MRGWAWGLLGGLTGAGVVVGALAYRKHQALKRRALEIRAALEADADALTLYLATKGEGIGPEVQAMARDATERTATYHLATAYGITPDFVALVTRAASRVGSA